MTPTQKIKFEIIKRAAKDTSYVLENIDEDNIDELYDELRDDDEGPLDIIDEEYQFREGDVETGLPCDYSRYFETKSVATQLEDGSWIGWTYYYGGGKHAEPESVEWMEHAYDLKVTEEEKLVIVRTFKKV